jgi:ABC-type multidrug transport system permease subunit
MRWIAKRAAKFLIAWVVMTFLCTVIWENCVAEVLYKCTDPGWLDFLFPGFVHGTDGALLYGDTIRHGWSLAAIWRLWWFFVAASVAISLLLASLRWLPSKKSEVPQSHDEHPHAA